MISENNYQDLIEVVKIIKIKDIKDLSKPIEQIHKAFKISKDRYELIRLILTIDIEEQFKDGQDQFLQQKIIFENIDFLVKNYIDKLYLLQIDFDLINESYTIEYYTDSKCKFLYINNNIETHYKDITRQQFEFLLKFQKLLIEQQIREQSVHQFKIQENLKLKIPHEIKNDDLCIYSQFLDRIENVSGLEIPYQEYRFQDVMKNINQFDKLKISSCYDQKIESFEYVKGKILQIGSLISIKLDVKEAKIDLLEIYQLRNQIIMGVSYLEFIIFCLKEILDFKELKELQFRMHFPGENQREFWSQYVNEGDNSINDFLKNLVNQFLEIHSLKITFYGGTFSEEIYMASSLKHFSNFIDLMFNICQLKNIVSLSLDQQGFIQIGRFGKDIRVCEIKQQPFFIIMHKQLLGQIKNREIIIILDALYCRSLKMLWEIIEEILQNQINSIKELDVFRFEIKNKDDFAIYFIKGLIEYLRINLEILSQHFYQYKIDDVCQIFKNIVKQITQEQKISIQSMQIILPVFSNRSQIEIVCQNILELFKQYQKQNFEKLWIIIPNQYEPQHTIKILSQIYQLRYLSNDFEIHKRRINSNYTTDEYVNLEDNFCYTFKGRNQVQFKFEFKKLEQGFDYILHYIEKDYEYFSKSIFNLSIEEYNKSLYGPRSQCHQQIREFGIQKMLQILTVFEKLSSLDMDDNLLRADLLEQKQLNQIQSKFEAYYIAYNQIQVIKKVEYISQIYRKDIQWELLQIYQ